MIASLGEAGWAGFTRPSHGPFPFINLPYDQRVPSVIDPNLMPFCSSLLDGQPGAPVLDRANALLANMTVEEKVVQLIASQQVWYMPEGFMSQSYH